QTCALPICCTERSKRWFWLGVVTALIGLLVFADNLVQDERNFAPVCYLTFSLLFWLLFWQSHSAWGGFYCLDGSRLFFVDGIPSDAAVNDFNKVGRASTRERG